jgi:delta24-sterol reductase
LGWLFYKSEDGTASKDGNGDLTLNFGVWGPTDPTPAAVRTTNRDLEEKLRELRGMKVPYAANYYNEAEFWNLYDRQKYNALRKRWHAEALPNMFDKVRRREVDENEGGGPVPVSHPLTWKESILQIWPLGGLYQIFHGLFR